MCRDWFLVIPVQPTGLVAVLKTIAWGIYLYEMAKEIEHIQLFFFLKMHVSDTFWVFNGKSCATCSNTMNTQIFLLLNDARVGWIKFLRKFISNKHNHHQQGYPIPTKQPVTLPPRYFNRFTCSILRPRYLTGLLAPFSDNSSNLTNQKKQFMYPN